MIEQHLEYNEELSAVIRSEITRTDLVNRALTIPGIPKYEASAKRGGLSVPGMNSDLYHRVYWYYHDYKTLDIELNLPLVNYKWWIMLLYPGQFLPAHSDPDVKEGAGRYSVPLQDYINGHAFVINDVLFANYKAGDAYKWIDVYSPHWAANISTEPRLTLQIGTDLIDFANHDYGAIR